MENNKEDFIQLGNGIWDQLKKPTEYKNIPLEDLIKWYELTRKLKKIKWKKLKINGQLFLCRRGLT